MQDRMMFREMLSEIKKLADAQGNTLTADEINDFFSHAHLEKEQLEMIYEYLAGQKIQIKGYEANCLTEFSEEIETQEMPVVNDSMEMYLEDLNAIPHVTEEEEKKLFERAVLGDTMAKSRLVELHLKTVYEIALTYLYQELPVSDLIQEGNIALMLVMDQLELFEDLAQYHAQIFDAVSQAMEDALMEQRDRKDMNEVIEERVNHLNEAIQNLERELEHKVSMEELSAYLEMPLEEIRDILRMAGDELEVEKES